MAKPYGKPVANCPHCSKPIGVDHPYSYCMECDNTLPLALGDVIPFLAKRRSEELARREIENREASKEKLIRSIALTTAPSLEGFRVMKTLDVIAAECVLGVSIVREAFASLTDIAGGRSKSIQKSLAEAKMMCLYELRKQAFELGGNAVIAVDLDYSEISGGGKSMMFLVASGTAVQIQRLENRGIDAE